MTSSTFTRINPPTSSADDSKTGLPFSIDTALAGTVPAYKSKSIRSIQRKGWHFDIHEDTPDDEMANLMEHSTCTLDISDDESFPVKGDKDNKENVPPVDAIGYSASRITATRRDMMTDGLRGPICDLDAEEFYAEGCDSSSFIIIPAEVCPDEKAVAASNIEEPYLPSRPLSSTVMDGREGWKDILAEMAAKTAATATETSFSLDQESSKEEPAVFQIWESESAKGDDDGEAQVPAADGVDPRALLP